MKKSIAILSIVLLAAGCGQKSKEQQMEELKAQITEKQNAAADLKTEIEKLNRQLDSMGGKIIEQGTPVEEMKLVAAPFVNYLEVMGKVDAEENVNVSSEMPGTISRINVKPGDVVNKGSVLAETDSKALQQSISDLQTNMELVNTLYEKQKSLWDQKIGTEVQFLQMKNQKESLEKKMAALKEQLNMTKLISPIDGVVDAVDVKVGGAVAPGFPAIRVINMKNLKVKAEVAEKFAPQIKTGTPVRILIPDMNDSLDTKVTYAARAINMLNRTFTVEVNLDNSKEYHPNMFARMKITTYTSAAGSISVPMKLIQRDGTNSYVMLDVNGKAVKRVVKLGQNYNGVTEITEGLKDGEVVITNGHIGLMDGDKISVAK